VEVTFLGHSSFRLRGKDVSVVTDPYKSPAGQPPLKVQADVITISHDQEGYNNHGAVLGDPKIIRGPGEYEIRGVLITGVATYLDSASGRERGRNTVYVMQMDDLRLCHVGGLGHVLSTEQIDEIGPVDVLFVPATSPVLDIAKTAEVISQIEPTIIVPMHVPSTDEAGMAAIEKFCHEMGLRQIVPQPKLAITRSSLPQETQVVVLDARQ
jgi:L-ascorbate metabolism protein UlaG (beta-lactamase superfamily)